MDPTVDQKPVPAPRKASPKMVFVSTPDMKPVVPSRKAAAGGTPAAPAPEEAAARAFGLELQGLARERLLSRTFRARSPVPGAPLVALVVVSDAATVEDRALFARMAQDLQAAGQAAPRVQRVKGISPSRDAFVTDLWTAGSARDLSALHWTPRHRAEFFRTVVTALEGLHALELVHGCLCPANVLLDDDLAPVLTEPGSVPVHALVERGADAALYTGFAAPEVLAGSPATPRSDVYSMGRVLAEAFEDVTSPAIAEVVARCVARDPEARFETAAALGAAIDFILPELPDSDAVVPAPTAAPPPPATPRPPARPAPSRPRAEAYAPPGRAAPRPPWTPPRWLAPAGAVAVAGAFGLGVLAGGPVEGVRALLLTLAVVGTALATTIAPPLPKSPTLSRLGLALGAAVAVLLLDPMPFAYRLAAQRHMHGDEASRRTAAAEMTRLGRDFRGLSLAHADLSGMDLAGADLRNVDLTGANLSRARMFGAEVMGASFDGANLAGADLDHVPLELASVGSASCDASTHLPAGWTCRDEHLARAPR
ncbi:MAG TPA: pentapeptide repeat-containing protein [Polyangiaceae bacterium]|jgi:hypothetical protein